MILSDRIFVARCCQVRRPSGHRHSYPNVPINEKLLRATTEQVHNFQQDPKPPLFKPPPVLHLRLPGTPPPRPDELDHELFPVTTQDDIGLDILPKLARIGVSLSSYDIDFTLECEIIRFIRQEKEMGRPIESAITITGLTNRALATTCEEYMNWQWPKTGTRLLKCLAQAEATNNGPLYTDSHTNVHDTIGSGM